MTPSGYIVVTGGPRPSDMRVIVRDTKTDDAIELAVTDAKIVASPTGPPVLTISTFRFTSQIEGVS